LIFPVCFSRKIGKLPLIYSTNQLLGKGMLATQRENKENKAEVEFIHKRGTAKSIKD
jgi:hypothetical protein